MSSYEFGPIWTLDSKKATKSGLTTRLARFSQNSCIKTFQKAWNNACERAGVPDRWFHDLRRTAVRNMERVSVPRSVAMKLTGHKTEAVYRRYAIADRRALEEGVEKLAKLHPPAATSRRVIPIQEAEA